MNLLRGFSDDLELFEWLNEHIWPMEARLEKHDIYVGTKLAALEMIKSGTVFANDMYWYAYESAKAFDEMGMRACIGICTITNGTEPFEQNLKQVIIFSISFLFFFTSHFLNQTQMFLHFIYQIDFLLFIRLFVVSSSYIFLKYLSAHWRY